MDNNVYLIKAPCHQSSRQQGFQVAPDFIKSSFNHDLTIDDFDGTIISNQGDEHHQICTGYQKLYEHILNYKGKSVVGTIGGDHSVSAATIAAMNEKYIKTVGNKCYSDLRVIYIDPYPDLGTYNSSQTKNLPDMVSSSLFGLMHPTFTKHKLLLQPEQIVYLGLTQSSDIDTLNELDINYLTLDKINQLTVEKSVNYLKECFGFDNKPVHISIDLKAIHKDYAPSTVRDGVDSGLTLEQLKTVLNAFKEQTVSFDITEFNPTVGDEKDVVRTKETVTDILVNCYGLKKKSINIFNDSSEFLVYRPLEQGDPDTDYGWFVLRGMALEDREQLLKALPDDRIISVTMEDDDYLITKTTIDEQNSKTYYGCNTIMETVLFPEEKKVMCFELLNC